jgi:4-carboxymuconolactone decarboxylase
VTRRLPALDPAVLSDEQRALYEVIAGGRRARGRQSFPLTDARGRLNGPFDAMLRSPSVGGALQQLGSALRYSSSLPGRSVELVILTTANAEASGFELYAHEAIGRDLGLTEEDLQALRDGAPVPGADATEAALIALARMLLTDRDLDDDAYARSLGVLGERAILEVLTLVGYYQLLAMQLRVFGIGVPETAAADGAPPG